MKRQATVSPAAEHEAERLIREFAAELLRLTGGRPIPTHWRAKLAKALEPAPRRPGLTIDAASYSAVAQLLAHDIALGPRRAPETKAAAEQRIAKATGASIRTVQRVRAELRRTLAALVDETDAAPPDDARRAILDGIAAELVADLSAQAPRKRRPAP